MNKGMVIVTDNGLLLFCRAKVVGSHSTTICIAVEM